MKYIAFLVFCSLLNAGATTYACTDPSPKKAVCSSDDATIVYEYFRPAKLADKKKTARTLTAIADSLLADAKQKYETENRTSQIDSRITATTKGAPSEHREQAEFELYRIKTWADSICNSFRRGYYKIGPEDAPR